MIVLKTKIIKTEDDKQLIEVKKYKHKHTSTLEHLLAIDVLINSILEYDKEMSLNKIIKMIKVNYEKKD